MLQYMVFHLEFVVKQADDRVKRKQTKMPCFCSWKSWINLLAISFSEHLRSQSKGGRRQRGHYVHTMCMFVCVCPFVCDHVFKGKFLLLA